METLDFKESVIECTWDKEVINKEVDSGLQEEIDDHLEGVLQKEISDQTDEVHYEVAAHSVV